jgi:uncharacterized flavoprotein (TIGR03862 family)
MARMAVIGGGPAGLMAAEVLAEAGHAVTVFEAMPTMGRKFLMAGKSGLNITHSEPHGALRERYSAVPQSFSAALDAFTADDLRAWCDGLGVETFVGSSGRVFPKVMKASPMLRAWLARLEALGVSLRTRHRWVGLEGETLAFDTPDGIISERFDATILALGGASWPRLGSDGAWATLLAEKGVALAPFKPANCGFEIAWSPIFVERFAGAPVKSVTATSAAGTIQGEFVITTSGVEGGLVYAHAAPLRDALLAGQSASLLLDLVPGRPAERLAADIARQPQKLSFSNRLRKGAGLDPVKALPIPLVRPRPIDRAISTAGGVEFAALDDNGMLREVPGLFPAGEMLDWEAPTGGYLLTACFATGRAAAHGAMTYLKG